MNEEVISDYFAPYSHHDMVDEDQLSPGIDVPESLNYTPTSTPGSGEVEGVEIDCESPSSPRPSKDDWKIARNVMWVIVIGVFVHRIWSFKRT